MYLFITKLYIKLTSICYKKCFWLKQCVPELKKKNYVKIPGDCKYGNSFTFYSTEDKSSATFIKILSLWFRLCKITGLYHMKTPFITYLINLLQT